MSIDHNLPRGLNYVASRRPMGWWRRGGGGGVGGVLQRSISRESHHVFSAVMASLRLYCID